MPDPWMAAKVRGFESYDAYLNQLAFGVWMQRMDDTRERTLAVGAELKLEPAERVELDRFMAEARRPAETGVDAAEPTDGPRTAAGDRAGHRGARPAAP